MNIVILALIVLVIFLFGINAFVKKTQALQAKERSLVFAEKRANEKLDEAERYYSTRTAYANKRIQEADDYYHKYQKKAWDEYEAEKQKAKNVYREEREEILKISTDVKQFVANIGSWNPLAAARFLEDLEFQLFHFTENISSHSTVKKYLEVRRGESRSKRQEAYRARYLCAYYESLFPDLSLLAEAFEDDSKRIFEKDAWWLPNEEYRKLTETERAQVTLSRYISGKKSNWAIGRDYEMFCGYLYRKEGYNVEQFGINKRLQDTGRDLICVKGAETLIVQCKFWSQNAIIYEKHIAQLFGTTMAYAMEQGLSADAVLNSDKQINKVVPVFVTSANLSDVALRFAHMLGVKVKKIEFDPNSDSFPRIKCNINNGEKIYHLPTDQKYDDTIINLCDGENYVFTAQEAKNLGFRRAQHWFGLN